MLRRLMLAVVVAGTVTTTAHAQELELALSDEMAELILADRNSQDANQSVRYGGGLLYNEDTDLLGSLFLTVNNEVEGRWQPVTFGVGTKLYGADLDASGESIAALAVGGNVGVGIPANIPLAIVLQGYVSPNITTGGDADRVTEGQIRLEAELVSGAHAFVGYRQIKFHMDEYRDERVDDGLHAGLRLRF
ncbi:YfaZ family outer membrane protein [Aquisalimonas sp.]|uniref:YfaZ family outer membrane protein n=1 Tax=unclassified Aquisalimonas TaxID=2644645 RepID=UPI0025BC5420|nr:YfaZ family outer membrane protein [Aquisalimonas sp.]